MSQYRIIHIDSGQRPGGGQRQAARLVVELLPLGHACRLVCPPASPIPETLREFQPNLALEPEECALRGSWDVGSAYRLLRIARDADLIHAHDARSHSLVRLAHSFGLRTPLVVHRRVAFPVRRSLLLNWKYLTGVAMYIAVSQAVGDALLAVGVPNDRIAIVPSCIDLDRYRELPAPPPDAPWTTDSPVVLSVGRLTAEKDHRTLVDAVAALSPMGIRASLVLVGDGPLRAELEVYGRERLGSDRFFMMGQRSDIPALLGAASVFALSSISEGCPMALFEAMAAGIPAVGTACGGAEMFLADGKTGRLVCPGDADGMAKALKAALSESDETERMAGEARRVTHRRLSAKAMVDGVLAVYDRVAEAYPC